MIVINLFVIVVIVVIVMLIVRPLLMSKELEQYDIDDYIKQLDEMSDELQIHIFTAMLSGDTARREGNIPSYREIRNEDDFHISFEALMDVEIMYDSMREVLAVNQCAWYMVKYYGKLVMKYGNNREKAVLNNNIKLLKLNKIISD